MEEIPSRVAVQRVCREQLRDEGIASALIGRTSTLALFGPPYGPPVRVEVALLATVAKDFGLTVPKVELALAAALLDNVSRSGLGARADERALGRMVGCGQAGCGSRSVALGRGGGCPTAIPDEPTGADERDPP